MDDSEVINFLLSTEIIPLALRIMESGSELSKTVATFIVQKVPPALTCDTHPTVIYAFQILLDDIGLAYICATAARFYAVSSVLSNMCTQLSAQVHRLSESQLS